MLMPLLNHVKVLMAQQAEEKEKSGYLYITRLKVTFYFIVSPIPLFFFFLAKIFFLDK